MKEIVLVIHNVRSAHNVGSLFRSADGAGVSHIYLSGYTPTPIDRFKRPQKEIAKTALGAEKTTSWEHRKTAGECIKELKRKDFYICALEQSPQSVPYTKKIDHQKIVLIVGNEVRGISGKTRSLCDIILEIPMRGRKNSLNVSVAGAIALYTLAE